jgi:hypothetical protein
MPTIYGRVFERFTHKPVMSASVSLKYNSTTTDNSGQFTLEVPTGYSQLVISHSLYRTYQRDLSITKDMNLGDILIDSIIKAL